MTTAIPSSEVNTIVKSFFVKILSKKARGPDPKKPSSSTHVEGGGRSTWRHEPLSRMSMMEMNENLSEAEKQGVTRFFAQIKTGRKYETDILAYELLNVSVGSIRCFPHRN